jgi:hypothetical protein
MWGGGGHITFWAVYNGGGKLSAGRRKVPHKEIVHPHLKITQAKFALIFNIFFVSE